MTNGQPPTRSELKPTSLACFPQLSQGSIWSMADLPFSLSRWYPLLSLPLPPRNYSIKPFPVSESLRLALKQWLSTLNYTLETSRALKIANVYALPPRHAGLTGDPAMGIFKITILLIDNNGCRFLCALSIILKLPFVYSLELNTTPTR